MENLTLFKLGEVARLGPVTQSQEAKAEIIRRMPYLSQATIAARKLLPQFSHHPVTLPEYPGLQFFNNGQEIMAFHHAWAHHPVWSIPANPIRSL